jgi:hypothetical protein
MAPSCHCRRRGTAIVEKGKETSGHVEEVNSHLLEYLFQFPTFTLGETLSGGKAGPKRKLGENFKDRHVISSA